MVKLIAYFWLTMRYLKKTLFLLILLPLLVSCFEIIEEVTLHKNGSGSITLTLNLSQSKSKLSSIMLLDSINNYRVPSESEITTFIAKIKKKIQNTSGVSNVKTTLNFDNYILKFSCDFKNVNALNQVISNFDKSNSANTNQFYYSANKQLFKRSYPYDLVKEFNKIKQADKKILKDASFTTIYRFDQEISSTSNSLSKISPNKKAVLIKVSGAALVSGKNSIKNKIQLLK